MIHVLGSLASLLFLLRFDQIVAHSILARPLLDLSANRQDLRAFDSLQARTNGASTSTALPLSCLRVTRLAKLIPTPFAVAGLKAFYSYLHASALGSWANQPPASHITVRYGRLQLHMESPLTTIPWHFVASFALNMLTAMVQQGVGLSMYDGHYSSLAICDLGNWGWDTFHASETGDTLVFVTLSIVPDPGNLLPK